MHVLDFDASFGRPRPLRLLVRNLMGRFLLEVLGVMDDTLDRVHVVLQFGDLTNHPSEGLLDADDVTERDTGLGRGDGKPAGDGKNGNDESEE
jgi:hypothetical protein